MASYYSSTPPSKQTCSEHLSGQLATDLAEIAGMAGPGQLEMEITCQLQAVREVLERHHPFLTLLDPQQQHLRIFQQQLYGLLRQQGIPQKVQQYLGLGFMRHCLDTLSREVLEFDEDTTQFIKQACAEGSSFKLNMGSVRKVLEELDWMGLLEECFEPVYQKLNRHCADFIEEVGDPEFKGEFLLQALKYTRTFLKSYLKGAASEKTEWLLGRYLGELEDNAHFLCGKFCIGMILEITFQFPETLQTILALKKCLDRAPLVKVD